jgi:hypothetical protein
VPVRDSTEWRHAQHSRKVVNLDSGTGRKIVCAWGECDRDGYENEKIVQHEHLRAWKVDGTVLTGDRLCEAIDAGVVPGLHRTYVFCSERHRNYFYFDHGPQGLAMSETNGGHLHGYLPVGYRGGIL